MTNNPNQRLHPQKRDELLSRSDVKQRLRVMDIITAAFFIAAAAYLWIASAGLLGKPPESDSGFPLWYVLVFLSISMVPLMLVLATVFLKQMQKIESGMEVLAKGQQLLIVELAIAEAVTIYGLIGVFLGASKTVQYSLMGFGILLMAAAVLVLRGRIIDLALVRLNLEAK